MTSTALSASAPQPNVIMDTVKAFDLRCKMRRKVTVNKTRAAWPHGVRTSKS
jgi:hypothetical protein